MSYPQSLTGKGQGSRFSVWLVRGILLPALMVAWAALSIRSTAAAVLSDNDKAIYREAFAFADRDQWPAALQRAADAKNPVLVDVLWWQRLQQPNNGADFAFLSSFVNGHPGWPAQSVLKRRTEEAISSREDTKTLLAWFQANPPFTGHGKYLFARTLMAGGQQKRATEVARDAWVNEVFSPEDENGMLADFGSLLTASHHQRRLDMLLWGGNDAQARRMFPRVSADLQVLAQARMALQDNARGAEGLVHKVPPSLVHDPGLLFDRLQWRRKKEQFDGAAEILALSAGDRVRPRKWWRERASLSRTFLQNGEISKAYHTAARHGMTAGPGYTEAEWLAGWIALRFLKDPRLAETHFRRLAAAATFAGTASRAAYWLGRTYEASGQDVEARRWYSQATANPVNYYGQLAAARLKDTSLLSLPAMPEITAEDRQQFSSSSLTHAARALGEVGEAETARSFLIRLTDDSLTPGQRSLAVAVATSFGRMDISVALARRAAARGTVLVDYAWPVPEVEFPATPETPLILSVIRQESNFHPGATSSAGARGLMQIMPATGKMLAKKWGIPDYAESRLTADPAFNIRLGAGYLAEMIDRFNGSYIMSVAGYNAGPGRSVRWSNDFGDPRRSEFDAVDWVEMIPFNETRNYVQRVTESLYVYRTRLNSKDRSRTLAQDLLR